MGKESRQCGCKNSSIYFTTRFASQSTESDLIGDNSNTNTNKSVHIQRGTHLAILSWLPVQTGKLSYCLSKLISTCQLELEFDPGSGGGGECACL